MTNTIIQSDNLKALRQLPADTIQCCVTSPPYYGLRDYEIEGQIGREDTPEQYIHRLVEVFREVRRTLRPDGTLWVNIADTYCGTGSKANHVDPKNPKGRTGQQVALNHRVQGCKHKDLIGIPWLLAFALRNDGWYLRNDIIWYKANPMPESVRDRCSRTYEHIFLLAKSKNYYYDAAAIAEPVAPTTIARMKGGRAAIHKYAEGIPGQTMQKINMPRAAGAIPDELIPVTRNKRDVWEINTVPYRGAHFAAFPPKLAETCILAGCPVDGIVLDPFLGSGTTGFVAKQLGRRYIGIEINAEYCRLANERMGGDEHIQRA
jgi:DNA modification methylase